MEITLKVEETGSCFSPTEKHEAWLLVDGVAVAWATTMYMDAYKGYTGLCDIETREGYQGKGYARKLTQMLAEHFGRPLAVSGSFTPEGFTAFHGKFPLLPVYSHDYDRPTFRSMTFVTNWDELIGVRY